MYFFFFFFFLMIFFLSKSCNFISLIIYNIDEFTKELVLILLFNFTKFNYVFLCSVEEKPITHPPAVLTKKPTFPPPPIGKKPHKAEPHKPDEPEKPKLGKREKNLVRTRKEVPCLPYST